MGDAFEKAPKGDVQKLVRVERAKSPIEPLESEELMEKFTRPKDDQFYEKLSYVSAKNGDFLKLRNGFRWKSKGQNFRAWSWSRLR